MALLWVPLFFPLFLSPPATAHRFMSAPEQGSHVASSRPGHQQSTYNQLPDVLSRMDDRRDRPAGVSWAVPPSESSSASSSSSAGPCCYPAWIQRGWQCWICGLGVRSYSSSTVYDRPGTDSDSSGEAVILSSWYSARPNRFREECRPTFDSGGNYRGVEIVPTRSRRGRGRTGR